MATALQVHYRADRTHSVSANFDALISTLKDAGEEECALIIEHLETAHALLLGAMPEECAANLEFAQQATHALRDKHLQQDVKQAVAEILNAIHAPLPTHSSSLHHPHVVLTKEPPPSATGLEMFFHGVDVKFGVFYPVHHTVAVFPSWERALDAKKALRAAGMQTGDLLAVPGVEVGRYLESRREHRGLWARLMSLCSRFLDTEVVLTDCYIEWAQSGAGFLVAYSQEESDLDAISELLKPFLPIAMHGFMPGYIRNLM